MIIIHYTIRSKLCKPCINQSAVAAALVESEATYLRHPCGTQFYLVVSRLIALHVATWPLNVKRCQCPRDFSDAAHHVQGGGSRRGRRRGRAGGAWATAVR